MARDGDGVPLLQARPLAEARYLVGRVAPWASESGKAEARSFAQRLGRLSLGETLSGPLHAWSSAIQEKSGPLTLPTMIRVLCGWLAERLENGGRARRR